MKHTKRRALVATVAMTATMTATAATGSAQAVTVSCGQTITADTTLSFDVGPCPNGGIIVGADNITLDLGGHRIFGTTNPGDGAGVYLLGRSGALVTNGSVSNFDAGVVIEGGSGNTVSKLRTFDNIGTGSTRFGDGIAIESSSSNKIAGVTAENNGPYSGIGLYSLVDAQHPRSTTGPSTNNVIQGNRVLNNVASRSGVPSETDNDGIRAEPEATGNFIIGNTVTGSGLDGISLFRGSSNNVVRGNTVEGSGFFRTAARRGSGIILFNLANHNLIEGNIVRNNADDGIVIRGPLGATPGSTNNVIRGNQAFGNSALPPLPSATFGPPTADLQDRNPQCDQNKWIGNHYGTAVPACVTNPKNA